VLLDAPPLRFHLDRAEHLWRALRAAACILQEQVRLPKRLSPPRIASAGNARQLVLIRFQNAQGSVSLAHKRHIAAQFLKPPALLGREAAPSGRSNPAFDIAFEAECEVRSAIEAARRRSAAPGSAQPWPFAIFPAEPESASTGSGFALCGYSRRLHLARVIGWINVSYPEWPLRLNLNDGGTAYPTVVVHFGRCFDISARR